MTKRYGNWSSKTMKTSLWTSTVDTIGVCGSVGCRRSLNPCYESLESCKFRCKIWSITEWRRLSPTSSKDPTLSSIILRREWSTKSIGCFSRIPFMFMISTKSRWRPFTLQQLERILQSSTCCFPTTQIYFAKICAAKPRSSWQLSLKTPRSCKYLISSVSYISPFNARQMCSTATIASWRRIN